MPGRFPYGLKTFFANRPWSGELGRQIDEVFGSLVAGMSTLQGSPSTPADVHVGDGGADAGDGPAPAMDDHVHDLQTAAPATATGKTADEGTAASVLRSDARVAQGIVTTKGDVLTHDGTTAERLAVGANDRVLMADSGQTTGLIWNTVAVLLAKLLTAKGDLLSHTGAAAVRKAVGADALGLTADAAQTDGLRWGPLVLSPAQIVANTNDYAPGRANVYRLNTDASRNITGLVAGTDGERRTIANVGAQPIVLKHQDAMSTAVNRFLSTSGSDVTLAADEVAEVLYDGTTTRWRLAKW